MLDMVTVYYASVIFLFIWFTKMLYLLWDRLYTQHHDDLNLGISFMVFLTCIVNFYTTEKINMDNLDKIESEM